MKVVVLGIDGFTFRILDPLIEKGFKLGFKTPKAESAGGIFGSTIPPIVYTGWMPLLLQLLPLI